MKGHNLASTNTSGYRAPELYDLGNIDKVQRYWFGIYFDYIYWLCFRYCR
ncbi:hypothetical protein [Moorena sp. SIO4G3]|nr:hypothetical protein [Moorena sp. SIO4G3]NEO77983.1 hypothetical protein [Moorena sp. SIO4G3]